MTSKFTRYRSSPWRLIGMLVSAFGGIARGGRVGVEGGGFGKSGCVGAFIGDAGGLQEGGTR